MNITQSPYTSNITKSQGTKTERVKSGSPKSDTIQDKAAVKISGSFKAKNTSRLPDQVSKPFAASIKRRPFPQTVPSL